MEKQIFQIINKLGFGVFFGVNLRPIFFCVFIAKFQFQQVADVEGKQLCCTVLRLYFKKQGESNNQCVSLFCTRNNCTAVKFSLRKTDPGRCSSESVLASITAVEFSENKPIQCRNRSQ